MTHVEVRGAFATVHAPGLDDEVAVEEPLEIRVDGAPIAITMRTPGDDEELALGFLHGEGLIKDARPAGPPPDLAANTIEVTGPLRKAPPPEPSTPPRVRRVRQGRAGRSGRRRARAPPGPLIPGTCSRTCPSGSSNPRSSAPAVCMPTGLFTPPGELIVVREDVGRHNAMDKVIGWALRRRLPLHGHVLCVSGRLSFELVQKAAVAQAPILVGVGAPSSLAIRLADDRGMTLAGFARGRRVNVYTGTERIT